MVEFPLVFPSRDMAKRACLAAFLSLASFAACAAPPSVAGTSRDVGFDDAALRHARVAIELRDEPRPLTFLAGPLEPDEIEEFRRAAPGVRLVAGLNREQAMAHAGEAHGADARFATPEFLSAAPKLVWLQAMSAGVDRYLAEPALRDDPRLVLTNLRGVHGPAISDHVFAMLLTLSRDLRTHWAQQSRGVWGRGESSARPFALEGRTLLVVGLGGIGSEVARRAHGFGMRVIATRRSDAPAPEFVARVGKPDELAELLGEADVVVIAVPLTPETDGLFGPEAFAAMRPGSILVNVARGRIVDHAALLAALDSGRLAGACLDVTDPEPLPGDHPLWKHAGVLITPHVSNDAELTDRRARALFGENLRRFGAGEPLLNVVDRAAGY